MVAFPTIRARPLPWTLLAVLASAVVAFAWILHEALVRLDGLQASAWDLGYDQQVVWNVAHGHNFYSSFAHANFLGIHFELVFLLPALIERFWPDPRVLLFFSAAGLAATAPAAYLFFRTLLPSSQRAPWLAAALAAPVPFWAATQQAARDDFHPENMAVALALLAAWAGLSNRPRLMWPLVLLVLCCKEDQVYTVGVIGLVVATQAAPAMRRQGRWVIAAAAAWLLVVVGVVQQLIRHGGYSDFFYYQWLLHPTPLAIAQALIAPAGWTALLVMIASLFGLPLLQPRWLLLVAPPMTANLLSHHGPQPLLQLHYALLPMFPVLVAGGLGARRWLEVSSPPALLVATTAFPALLLGYLAGTLPPADQADLRPYRSPNAAAELRRAASVIPPEAPVAADDGLTPWLADRPEIHGFPGVGDSSDYVVIDREAYVPGSSWKARHDAAVSALSAGERTLLYDDGRFQVWGPAGLLKEGARLRVLSQEQSQQEADEQQDPDQDESRHHRQHQPAGEDDQVDAGG